MRTVIAAGLLTGSLCAGLPAHAQSLPGSGLYVGLAAGYGWGGSQPRDEVIPQPPPPPPVVVDETPEDGNYRVRGGSLGLGAGYGFAFGQLLLGLEGDVNWSGIEGSSSVCGGDHTCGTRLDG